jgi:hypothetical protein
MEKSFGGKNTGILKTVCRYTRKCAERAKDSDGGYMYIVGGEGKSEQGSVEKRGIPGKCELRVSVRNANQFHAGLFISSNCEQE